jgi:Domain of unknown function (DUF4136)
MKKRILLTVIAMCVLALGNARAQDVRFNFDKDTDFSKFKTYKWVPIKDANPPNDITDKMIKTTIDTELATKGLTKTDAETADLYVGYQGAVSTEKEYTSYDNSWGYGRGWGYGGMATTTTTGQTSTIYIGQLVVDMYDPANKDLIWRGTASKTLDMKAKPDKQQKNLTKAVTKLFKNYPPEVKK